jgi:hypothetical protein
MFVATKLAKIKAASLFVASPSAYARAAVAAIGYEVTNITRIFVAMLQFNFLRVIFFSFLFVDRSSGLFTSVYYASIYFTSITFSLQLFTILGHTLIAP